MARGRSAQLVAVMLACRVAQVLLGLGDNGTIKQSLIASLRHGLSYSRLTALLGDDPGVGVRPLCYYEQLGTLWLDHVCGGHADPP